MLRWPLDNKIVLKPRALTATTPAAPANTTAVAGIPQPSVQKTVLCPFCQYQQPASLHGLSIFCRNCNRRIDLEGHEEIRLSSAARSSLRNISCGACQATQEVPSNALSAFCQKCGKRINMQDYQIRGKFNGDIQTKGTLTIAMGGDVHADVQVGNAIIEGKLHGTIRADGKVELRSTGYVRGNVFAKTIVVHEGAALLGRCDTVSSLPDR